MARKFFFHSTEEAAGRMTELFDFVWPAVAALVHARSKSFRHRALPPEQQRAALANAFLSNRALKKEYRSIPGLKRASLKTAFLDTGWLTQEQVFARLVLVNIFAIHEGWLDDLMMELQPPANPKVSWKKVKTFVDATQFPYANRHHHDWTWAISELNALKSPDMETCFGADLRHRRLYSMQLAPDYVVCYRYFKELRNAVMHRSGRAGDPLVRAQSSFSAVASRISQFKQAATPGTRTPVYLGDEVELSLYGVVGFNDVVLRLMATLDAEAAVTELAEVPLTNFFKNRTNSKSSSGHRDGTLRRMADDYGFYRLEHTAEFGSVLARHGVTIP